ncbi:hypothetical protein [Plantactinospora soyae]|uniref:Uncharacterized protein n=1 Tax=Plantactinospora soyae TaxID=1544732 RepID=A0A927MAF8_9ACTN|nr:hypothetical protein [Plantactinospora soyae]MBE1487465.1 hypothetical protein [Plantactinospora soyae]
MARSGARWKRPTLLGIALLYTGIRAPDILSEGSWRSWVAVPIIIALLWILAREIWTAARRQTGRSAASEERAPDS